MRNLSANMHAAHDVALAEPDDEARRELYRQLYRACQDLGRWADGKILQPFTGDPETKDSVELFLNHAVISGRVEDTLRCLRYSGLTLSPRELVSLWTACERRSVGDIVRQAVRLAANPHARHFDASLASLLVAIRGRKLSDVEEAALDLALCAHPANPPFDLE